MVETHSLHSEPKPIPKHPYSRDEIDDYAGRFVDIKVRNYKKNAAIHKRVLDYIEALPAWAQVLLIENRAPITIGNPKQLKFIPQAVGQSTPETYEMELNSDLHKKGNQDFEFYFSHEAGHSIDNILGNYYALTADRGDTIYMSQTNPLWTTRLNEDLSKLGRARNANLRRDMHYFLKDGEYPKNEYPRESFAVVTSHYFTEHFQGQNSTLLNDPSNTHYRDEAAINDHMEKHFPKLWPCYRDEILPHAIKIASRQYHARREREAEAHEHVTHAMEAAIDRVVKQHHCPPFNNPKLVQKLVNSQYTDWLNLFQRLSEPMPQETTPRLKVLFPAIFDPNWGAPEDKTYTARSFPELNKQIKYLTENTSKMLREGGIERFVNDYQELWNSLEKSIEHQANEKSQKNAR